MNTRNPPVPEAATSPCSRCGRIEDAGALVPIGILEGVEGKQPLILYQCRCGTTRAISWGQASERLRREARTTQTARPISREEERR